MDEKEKKKFTKISTGIIVLGIVFSMIGFIQSNNIEREELNQKEVLALEIESYFEKNKQLTQDKEKAMSLKTSILTDINKTLSKKSNLWNFIFYMKANDYKTIYISGQAKNDEAKQQLLSILSNIPNIHVIYEDIKVTSDNHKWQFQEHEFPKFNKEIDVINPNVKIIPYSEDESKNGNTNAEFIQKEYEKDLKALKELDSQLFDDPLLYKEITDIKTRVSEKVAEVSGIVSTKAHKERAESILRDLKDSDTIYAYVNNLIVKDNYGKLQTKSSADMDYLEQMILNIETIGGNISEEEKKELRKFHDSLIEYHKANQNEEIKKIDETETEELFKQIDEEIDAVKEVTEKDIPL